MNTNNFDLAARQPPGPGPPPNNNRAHRPIPDTSVFRSQIPLPPHLSPQSSCRRDWPAADKLQVGEAGSCD